MGTRLFVIFFFALIGGYTVASQGLGTLENFQVATLIMAKSIFMLRMINRHSTQFTSTRTFMMATGMRALHQ